MSRIHYALTSVRDHACLVCMVAWGLPVWGGLTMRACCRVRTRWPVSETMRGRCAWLHGASLFEAVYHADMLSRVNALTLSETKLELRVRWVTSRGQCKYESMLRARVEHTLVEQKGMTLTRVEIAGVGHAKMVCAWVGCTKNGQTVKVSAWVVWERIV